jgi:hypothetical protein
LRDIEPKEISIRIENDAVIHPDPHDLVPEGPSLQHVAPDQIARTVHLDSVALGRYRAAVADRGRAGALRTEDAVSGRHDARDLRARGPYRAARRSGAEAPRPSDPLSRRVCAGEPGPGPGRAQSARRRPSEGGQRGLDHGPSKDPDVGATPQACLCLFRRRFACLN